MGAFLDDVTACTDAIRGLPRSKSEEEEYDDYSGSIPMLAIFILYILISSFTMLNMLTGIMFEVVNATAEGEKAKASEMVLRETINAILPAMDKDKNNEITRDEFTRMARSTRLMTSLEKLGIDRQHYDK